MAKRQQNKQNSNKEEQQQHEEGNRYYYTTIQLTVALRDRLKALGKKGESYEDIIERLLLRPSE